MSYLRGFLPWIAYAAVSSVLDWRAAAVAALVVSVWAIADQRRHHGDVDDLASDHGLVLRRPDPPERPRPDLAAPPLHARPVPSDTGSHLYVVVAAVRSRSPSPSGASARVWDVPAFIAANVTITDVWTVSFIATAAVCALTLAVTSSATPVWLSAEVLGFVVPVKFRRSTAGAPGAR